jgi:hypothetical protein
MTVRHAPSVPSRRSRPSYDIPVWTAHEPSKIVWREYLNILADMELDSVSKARYGGLRRDLGRSR